MPFCETVPLTLIWPGVRAPLLDVTLAYTKVPVPLGGHDWVQTDEIMSDGDEVGAPPETATLTGVPVEYFPVTSVQLA